MSDQTLTFRRGDSVALHMAVPDLAGHLAASPTHRVRIQARPATGGDPVFTFDTDVAESDAGLTITPLADLVTLSNDFIVTTCNFELTAAATATGAWTPGDYVADIEVMDTGQTKTYPTDGTRLKVRITDDVTRA